MKIRNKDFDFEKHVYVMGILNVTPDSFSDGGTHNLLDDAVAHARRLIDEGADIIDIGGESTRPGYTPVEVYEEIDRVVPVISALRRESDVVISVDTTKAQVAKAAIEAGADIINDVSGFLLDAKMAEVTARLKVPCILMHDGNYFKNSNTAGNSYIEKVKKELELIVDNAISKGIATDSIIIDPGVGFGKTYEENLAVIREISALKGKYPILLGCSRKSVIGNALSLSVDQRVEGTITTSIMGAIGGACIVRVHDVKENKRALAMYEAIMGNAQQ